MSDLVRVKDPVTGQEFTAGRSLAIAAGLTPLNKAAVDVQGRPLPPKSAPLHKVSDARPSETKNKPAGKEPGANTTSQEG